MNYQSKRPQSPDIHDILVAHLTQDVGIEVREATARHWPHAAALTVRADLIQRWHETNNLAAYPRPEAGGIPVAWNSSWRAISRTR